MSTYQLSASTVFDRIRQHYAENLELPSDDIEVLDRLKAAHSLLLNESENDANIVKTMMKRFSISERTAYYDLRTAKNVFGDVRSASREAMRYIVTQWATDIYRMAKQSKNLKAMEKALEKIIKANNLDKDDLDMPDASKIQPPVQLLSINFNLINSPRFKLIDEAAQDALIKLYDEVMAKIVITPLGEYADLFAIDDSVRPKKKLK